MEGSGTGSGSGTLPEGYGTTKPSLLPPHFCDKLACMATISSSKQSCGSGRFRIHLRCWIRIQKTSTKIIFFTFFHNFSQEKTTTLSAIQNSLKWYKKRRGILFYFRKMWHFERPDQDLILIVFGKAGSGSVCHENGSATLAQCTSSVSTELRQGEHKLPSLFDRFYSHHL